MIAGNITDEQALAAGCSVERQRADALAPRDRPVTEQAGGVPGGVSVSCKISGLLASRSRDAIRCATVSKAGDHR
jgi:hypothetical protein